MIIVHKDRIHLYMLRNLLGTFFVSVCAFVLSLMCFYGCGLIEAIQRLVMYDVYTTLYFLLLWLCDYLIFEVSKILYDAYQERLLYKPIIGLVLLGIISFILPIHSLFQFNLILLCILIIMRIVKQMYKRGCYATK